MVRLCVAVLALASACVADAVEGGPAGDVRLMFASHAVRAEAPVADVRAYSRVGEAMLYVNGVPFAKARPDAAGINFGLQGAPELEKAALDAGCSPTWAGMPVLTVVLWGGVLTQLAWAIGQHRRHTSFGDYLKFSTSQVLNFGLSVAVGIIGVMQFVLQKAGEPLMGDFRYISFAVLMSSAVFFSAVLGVFLGEWKGTSARTRLSLSVGILMLVAGFTVTALAEK